MVPTAPLFPTFVVGSLPRPQWVRDLIEERKVGHISDSDAERLLDDAVPSAVRMQERAGVDYISDGEWRRESYVKVFTKAVDGFTDDLISTGGSSPISHLGYPAVTSEMSVRRPIAVDEAEFLRKNTKSKIIVAVPSPYTIGRRMWSAEHSAVAYPTREEFIEACIPIVRDEAHRLAALGVDMVQLDDPWLGLLVDPEYRAERRNNQYRPRDRAVCWLSKPRRRWSRQRTRQRAHLPRPLQQTAQHARDPTISSWVPSPK